MRAAVFHEVGKRLSIERVLDPIVDAGQVIIEVAEAGICGSDLHITEYGLVPGGTILGHEFAGTVVALGANVAPEWNIGDRVTALPFHACRRCDACEVGLPALCSSVLFTGTRDHPGAYAEYVGARAGVLQRLPAGVTFSEGAMVEPLAVAHHAVEMAKVSRDDAVLVMGAGPIGAAAAMFARSFGARHVIVSEPSAERRALALELGATAVIDPISENAASRFSELAGMRPRVVLECVGKPGLVQQAVELAGIRARIVIAGVCFSEDKFKPMTALSKEVSIQFAQCYTERNFDAVIDAIAFGKVDPKPMHSRTVGLSALPEEFEGLRSDPSACKILIDPRLA